MKEVLINDISYRWLQEYCEETGLSEDEAIYKALNWAYKQIQGARKNGKLSESDRQDIINLLESGSSVKSLSEKYHVSHQYLYKLKKDMGIC